MRPWGDVNVAEPQWLLMLIFTLFHGATHVFALHLARGVQGAFPIIPSTLHPILFVWLGCHSPLEHVVTHLSLNIRRLALSAQGRSIRCQFVCGILWQTWACFVLCYQWTEEDKYIDLHLNLYLSIYLLAYLGRFSCVCVCIKSLVGLVKYGITIDLISNIPKRSIFL